eukprot:TRINITY_DN37797_c0_g1_i1.p1 TRINITY_DN37797_c0_g1~~TRINITY_DN37797_c0_g1_i1.p1  ORF type:complete len:462 (-),score=88.57 TRINITY_DN37797_c0_g1_i1:113-1498(-)
MPETSEEAGAAQPPAPAEAKPASGIAYAGYYCLLFFAYWFGANRFDVDGDGDFDPSDVQAYLQDKGFLKRNKKMTSKEKVRRSTHQETKAQVENKKKQRESYRQEKEEEKKRRKEEQGIFDRDGDGDVDLDDLLENEVEGVAQEEEALKNLRDGRTIPFFMIFEILVTGGLWTVMAILVSSRDGRNWLMVKAGLDSFFDVPTTNLQVATNECVDLRPEAWRWISYQFTHVGITHIGMNTLLNVILGFPLEAMHGWWRMAVMFNVGVVGGACAYFVADSHNSVVGCSGGCYSLIGIHVADLIMNWSQKKFRLPTILLIGSLIAVDLVSYYYSQSEGKSNAAHFGGAVAGLCIGVLVCENKVVKKCERYLMMGIFIFGMLLTNFCLVWLYYQNAGPRNIFEAARGESGWCWIRVVLSQQINPAAFECIKCGTQACIDEYSAMGTVRGVDPSYCDQRGYFHIDR